MLLLKIETKEDDFSVFGCFYTMFFLSMWWNYFLVIGAWKNPLTSIFLHLTFIIYFLVIFVSNYAMSNAVSIV